MRQTKKKKKEKKEKKERKRMRKFVRIEGFYLNYIVCLVSLKRYILYIETKRGKPVLV
jgi:cell division protein FtsL